jgi:rhodanese-related sulfurtransferase
MDHIVEFMSNHYLLVLALAVVIFLLIQELIETILSPFKSVSPMQAVAYMNTQTLVIVDVREPHEFASGHIENAINLPSEKLKSSIQPLERYKTENLLLVCQSGTRSSTVCKQLSKAGFAHVVNLSGGMQAWEDAKFPIRNLNKNKAFS